MSDMRADLLVLGGLWLDLCAGIWTKLRYGAWKAKVVLLWIESP